MKILFQEPLVERSITYGKFEAGAGNNTFPYGVACIASYLRERGFSDVHYLEPSIEKMDANKYARFLHKYSFDVIGIGSTTLQVGRSFRTFELAKRVRPDIITVLGGVHGTLMPRESLEECAAVDYIILGEGEKPFYELLRCLRDGDKKGIGLIRGIAFREKGKVVISPPDYDNMLAPEELPFPAYDLFPMRKYIGQTTFSKVFPTYSLIASRGCPFKCGFCNANDVLGRRVRYKEVDRVIDEVLFLKKRYGARGIMFLDSTFTLNGKWVEEFCHKMIERKVGLPWACNSRVDTVSERLLRLMKKAGCWEVVFGVESWNQKSLDLINKGTTVEQNEKALKACMKAGLFTFASYIICLPGENADDAMNTIRMAKKIGTHIAIFYLPIPFPKTPLYEICKKQGLLRKNAPWEDYNSWDVSNPIYINPLIGKKKMQRLWRYAILTYYLNPKVILMNLREIIFLRQDIRKYIYAAKSLLGVV